MSEYPEDVMQIADIITQTTTGTQFVLDSDRIVMAGRIAAAIMAERERCAKIAETMKVHEIGDRILLAASIRNGGDAS